MGTDDGRNGGTAVVDTNTKVYGTDNLFVVDASVIPGMMSANPSAMIVTIAERASERILALKPSTAVAKNSQCYGEGWTTSSACTTGTKCMYMSKNLWQCM
jgi:cellobiose dehydrogenase (acceptor)